MALVNNHYGNLTSFYQALWYSGDTI